MPGTHTFRNSFAPLADGGVNSVRGCRRYTDHAGSSTFPNLAFGWVSVKDVAEAHILAFEVPSANGRYLLVEKVAHYSEIVKILSKLYPGCTLPTKCVDDNPFAPTFTVSKERIEKLGLKYTPIEEALRDTVESLKEKKLLNLDSNL